MVLWVQALLFDLPCQGPGLSPNLRKPKQIAVPSTSSSSSESSGGSEGSGDGVVQGGAALEQAAGPRARGSARLSELVPGQSAYSQSGLRGLLPPIEGCFMTLESKWHTRWRVKCPVGPPNQTSKSFSIAAGKVSEKQAVPHCLKFAWQVHIRGTGEDPPLWQLQLEDIV